MNFWGNKTNPHKSMNWGTPPDLYRLLHSEFKFTFDPCPFRPKGDRPWDGLQIPWKSRNFVNPPYNDIEPWCRKAVAEQKKGNLSVLLLPSRTDVRYFHECIIPYAHVRFVKGRLKFVDLDKSSDTPTSAAFASIVCVYFPTTPQPNLVTQRKE